MTQPFYQSEYIHVVKSYDKLNRNDKIHLGKQVLEMRNPGKNLSSGLLNDFADQINALEEWHDEAQQTPWLPENYIVPLDLHKASVPELHNAQQTLKTGKPLQSFHFPVDMASNSSDRNMRFAISQTGSSAFWIGIGAIQTTTAYSHKKKHDAQPHSENYGFWQHPLTVAALYGTVAILQTLNAISQIKDFRKSRKELTRQKDIYNEKCETLSDIAHNRLTELDPAYREQALRNTALKT